MLIIADGWMYYHFLSNVIFMFNLIFYIFNSIFIAITIIAISIITTLIRYLANILQCHLFQLVILSLNSLRSSSFLSSKCWVNLSSSSWDFIVLNLECYLGCNNFWLDLSMLRQRGQ